MALRKACTVAVVATAAVVAAALCAVDLAGAVPAGPPPPAATPPPACGGEAAPGLTAEQDLYNGMTMCDYGMRNCLEPRADTAAGETASMCLECRASCNCAAGKANSLVWPLHERNLIAKSEACRLAPHAAWLV